MSNLQPVIPDDREAVARLHRLLANEFAAGETLAGACDDRPLVQAFASHRIKAALAMQERAAIAARDCMCDQEWPPQDGDVQIDEVMEAIRNLEVPE